ncbi:MAG: tRNA (N(6)-L-threonylcarbamoyladenosine(37)-C(2))-methylthiotransferase MtaB [Armatimonadetes bacterium]|nr:tRNA (N(6)-L-threonylcarbamoyladenosine(37)-C(2))-methylthiotransferase MtaB [Armatimonadota bacterium]
MPKAAFTTLGCKVNQYETQKILEDFLEAGFDVVPFEAEADVYVVNSCSVTAQAEAKSRYTVRKARRTSPGAKIVVTGCAAQMELNNQRGPQVPCDSTEPNAEHLQELADLLVPNPEKEHTLHHFLKVFPENAPAVNDRSVRPQKPTGRTRATLKIQDGCNVMCSYCSIPHTRPGLKSRHWREVLAEAQALAAAGYQEAVLTGVLIGEYGPETGSGGIGFEELVRRLAEDSGLARLRISSIEMHQVTPPIIVLAGEGTVAPHFHIPLQSGDDDVLSDMNRRYRQRDFLDLCARLYREVPGVSLTTDVMVGFPTESEKRFESSVKVLEEAQFLKAHVFRFSPRPGTPADRWGDPVDPKQKQARAQRLATIAERTGREHVRRFVGQTVRVLLEGKVGRDGLLEGLADNGITVKLSGPPELARTIQWARLEEERDGLAHAELAAGPPVDGLRVLG